RRRRAVLPDRLGDAIGKRDIALIGAPDLEVRAKRKSVDRRLEQTDFSAEVCGDRDWPRTANLVGCGPAEIEERGRDTGGRRLARVRVGRCRVKATYGAAPRLRGNREAGRLPARQRVRVAADFNARTLSQPIRQKVHELRVTGKARVPR